jgi:hypothetical protein
MEATIELEGIAIDDFARKFLTHAQCERTFARPGRAGDDEQGRVSVGIHGVYLQHQPSYPAGPDKPIY